MLISRFVAGVSAGFAMVLGAGEIYGQAFPNRPVRIYTTAPGGGSDFSARVISQTLPAILGQPVVIENRGGSECDDSGDMKMHLHPKSPSSSFGAF